MESSDSIWRTADHKATSDVIISMEKPYLSVLEFTYGYTIEL
jgi:hypothetical protein